MKRCPECRRDYYDDSLLDCLDDGCALLDGPTVRESLGSPGEFGDEPQTAILRETTPTGEPGTRAKLQTTEPTAVLPSGTADTANKGFDKRLLLAPLALAMIVTGGFLAYRLLSPSVSGQIGSIAVMPFVNDSGNAGQGDHRIGKGVQRPRILCAHAQGRPTPRCLARRSAVPDLIS